MKHPYIDLDTIEDVRSILESGKLSGFVAKPESNGGYWVQALEQEIKDKFNVKYAVTMNSATACLHSALVALGIGEGNKVAVTPYSFSSSVSCVKMVGAEPVFIDIEDDYFCINPLKVPYYVDCVIPVDLCGQSADYENLIPLSKPIIQDSAQAIGAKWNGEWCGLQGDCGIFSFNQSKQISSGEGGCLITNNYDIYRKAKAVRNHAEISDPELEITGYNYRMCEIEACIVFHQLKYLDDNISWRRYLCGEMTRRLDGSEIIPPQVREGCEHSYYTYAMKTSPPIRDKIQELMSLSGVYFGRGYVKPLYLLPIYGHERGLCPICEKVESEIMVTDIFRYPMEGVDKVMENLERCLAIISKKSRV